MLLLGYFAWTCIGIVCVILVSVFINTMLQNWHLDEDGKRLKRLYRYIWSGAEADRAAAWMRVVGHLKAFEPDQELIERAEANFLDAEQEAIERWKEDAKSDEFESIMIVGMDGELYSRHRTDPRFRAHETRGEYKLRAKNDIK